MSYYPPGAFYYEVRVEGFADNNECSFLEVSGIGSRMDLQEVREGGENRFSHKLPSATRFENLVLRRGMLVGSALIGWCRKALVEGTFEPRTVNVLLLSPPRSEGGKAETLVTWKFVKAYPVSWTVADLKSMESELTVETLELAYQYFETK